MVVIKIERSLSLRNSPHFNTKRFGFGKRTFDPMERRALPRYRHPQSQFLKALDHMRANDTKIGLLVAPCLVA